MLHFPSPPSLLPIGEGAAFFQPFNQWRKKMSERVTERVCVRVRVIPSICKMLYCLEMIK